MMLSCYLCFLFVDVDVEFWGNGGGGGVSKSGRVWVLR